VTPLAMRILFTVAFVGSVAEVLGEPGDAAPMFKDHIPSQKVQSLKDQARQAKRTFLDAEDTLDQQVERQQREFEITDGGHHVAAFRDSDDSDDDDEESSLIEEGQKQDQARETDKQTNTQSIKQASKKSNKEKRGIEDQPLKLLPEAGSVVDNDRDVVERDEEDVDSKYDDLNQFVDTIRPSSSSDDGIDEDYAVDRPMAIPSSLAEVMHPPSMSGKHMDVPQKHNPYGGELQSDIRPAVDPRALSPDYEETLQYGHMPQDDESPHVQAPPENEEERRHMMTAQEDEAEERIEEDHQKSLERVANDDSGVPVHLGSGQSRGEKLAEDEADEMEANGATDPNNADSSADDDADVLPEEDSLAQVSVAPSGTITTSERAAAIAQDIDALRRDAMIDVPMTSLRTDK